MQRAPFSKSETVNQRREPLPRIRWAVVISYLPRLSVVVVTIHVPQQLGAQVFAIGGRYRLGHFVTVHPIEVPSPRARLGRGPLVSAARRVGTCRRSASLSVNADGLSDVSTLGL